MPDYTRETYLEEFKARRQELLEARRREGAPKRIQRQARNGYNAAQLALAAVAGYTVAAILINTPGF